MPMNLVRLFQQQRVKVDFLLCRGGECAHTWKGTAVSSPEMRRQRSLREFTRDLMQLSGAPRCLHCSEHTVHNATIIYILAKHSPISRI